MRLPLSTYRLQIRESLTLTDAAELTDYVTSLGADWVYLSPLLVAESGSDHGYDVVDHSRIDPVRGGASGLEALSKAARAAGRGVLVDIVPNHMGVATPSLNAWWWDLLTLGQASRFAEAFDVDWEAAGGKIRIPVLGDGDTELDSLTLVDGQLHYYDNAFPVAPGTADDGADVRTIHDRQNYELVNWRRADAELNYRRFFAVNTLAGIRVEVPWVFAESHAEIVRWVRDGLVDGLRVDHPDGLADPGGYLDALQQATGGTYVLVEKILEGDEQMPPSWAAAGTTGYDALGDIDRVFVDPDGQVVLDDLEGRLQGVPADIEVVWPEMIYASKRNIADGILRSEVLRLARLVPEITDADDAIAELLAAFPVYRSYLPYGIEHLHHAARAAAARRPELASTIDALVPVLSDPDHLAAIRFQQTSGMVMAKGVEDTAFYRFSRLTSLNEVGADPGEFSIDVAEFHSRQQHRQASIPASMTTLSTHDTKRGEDVRARIAVIAEIPGEWEATLAELRERAPLGDGPFEKLLWEAVIGAWPISQERLDAYAEKAAREAGTSTMWTQPNEAFEKKMHDLVAAVFTDDTVSQLVSTFVQRVARAGWSNSLGAKLVQLTAPGVPDVYQGSELWETSLVDPDNRRHVDFDVRKEYLARVDRGWLPEIDETGAAKLLVTSRALRLRRDHPEWFSRYLPVPAYGDAADHVLAFDRGDAVTVATRLPLGLEAAGGWGDTTIELAGRRWVDSLTGERYPGGAVRLADLLATYPVALLVADDFDDHGMMGD
ncbi:malto-oligosyltrehalose synthase [Mycetocola manganoxydans]|uniref:Malto-oligosyltrehalose synthase n=1 Tax=Mycetocola manganoxydans TaxID=699879 RepID=A0A3L6ZX58_9MICO|nr:malto-oligosyltrehalose synthase [Mycetocola manganoxydans]RLP72368.1 malto-oligosyltrehalose synthase [Mycetocola manganoxydans]GHD40714.1 malto-oligosyltrehalose synthase [Mycetocola manganoxydans]